MFLPLTPTVTTPWDTWLVTAVQFNLCHFGTADFEHLVAVVLATEF
jgi:hypothetical protein